MPSDADRSSHRVEHGDVFIFATDGVWDNLSSQQVLKVVSHHMREHCAWRTGQRGARVRRDLRLLTDPTGDVVDQGILQATLATAITQEAKAASKNRMRNGPFAEAMHQHFPGENFRGGKADDICVVVLIVVEDQPPHKKSVGAVNPVASRGLRDE